MNRILAILGLLAVLAVLAGCASQPSASGTPWNGGTWNSVLGYHGPSNSMSSVGGP